MRIALLAGVGLVATLGLRAATVGPDCSNCFGSIYTLQNQGLVSSTATTQTYNFAYTIDTSGFVGPQSGVNYYIGSLALKVTSALLGATLFGSPTGTGSWSLSTNTNVNNSGCAGNGAGWVCVQGGQAWVPNGSVYTWDFTITMATGSLLDAASIQANYDPPNGVIMSQTVWMPEGTPTELPIAVTAAGIWLVWRKARKYAAARNPIA
jgi:hypothetical protein